MEAVLGKIMPPKMPPSYPQTCNYVRPMAMRHQGVRWN